MRKCKYGIFLLFAVSLVVASQPEWKAAAALKEKSGVESINVKVTKPIGETITLEYSIPAPVIKQESNSYVSIQCGNSENYGLEGEPVLPVIPVKVIIPSGRTIKDIKVTSSSQVTLPGKYKVIYQEAYQRLIDNATPRTIKPNASIFGSDNPFPASAWHLVSEQKKNGVTIAIINLSPIIYKPLSGQVMYRKDMKLEIITTAQEPKLLPARIFPDRIDTKKMEIENPEAISTYTTSSASSSGVAPLGICNPADNYSYVIVTSAAIHNATTDYTVRDLVAHRISQGKTATIVDMETVLVEYQGRDNSEKLRNFIIDAYTNWETQYVLLGGDITVVPMRKFYQTLEGGEQIPSDLYFQCLDGTFNYDNDNLWGESTDGVNGGEIDLLAEVYIGRASAETPAEMSNFVYKTLKYETDPNSASYLYNALMCGEQLGFGGISEYATASMEEIRTGTSEHGYTTVGFTSCPTFTVSTLYDASGYDWPVSEIISRINSDQLSIINHLGHANYNYVLKMSNANADALTNNNPLFLYSQGCIPGNFEADCIAEHFTTSTRHGLYGGVMNSRYGWGAFSSTDGPSQRYNRQFWDAYFGENINMIGQINADSHEDNAPNISDPYARWCYYETNLFGDPCTMMRGKLTGPFVSYTSNNVTEVTGNHDGIINPGEQIQIGVNLLNTGTESAAGVTASLSTTSTYVTLVEDQVQFGTIPCCGSSRPSLTGYVLNISSTIPTPATITLNLDITDGNNHSWNGSFTIDVNRSFTVSGAVRTLTGNQPIADATVAYSGTRSGSVTTNSQGQYSFSVIQGTYALTTQAAGYLNSVISDVAVSGNTTVNILMSRPVMSLSAESINESVTPGGSTTSSLTISNTGDAALTYSSTVLQNMSQATSSTVSTYDASHFVTLAKGEIDTRVGKPAIGSGGPTSFGYRWKDSDEPNGPAYQWTDISTTGTLLSSVSGCDDCYESVNIGFQFKYYNTNYTSIYVSSNGYVTLGTAASGYSNYPLPSSNAPLNIIAGYWDDLNPYSAGDVFFQSSATRAIIQFNNVALYNGSGTVTFQIVLNANGKINLYYRDVSTTTNDCTVGMQNQTRDDGLTVAYNTPYLKNNLAVEIVAAPTWVTITTLPQDRCDPGAQKEIALRFDALELTAGTYTGSLTINHNDPDDPNPTVVPITLNVTTTQIPVITTQPADATAFIGETAEFSIEATGTPLQYQWQRNSTNIAGATNSSYTTPVLTSSDNGALFRCIVSNSAGQVTSQVATLTVVDRTPEILTQPSNVTTIEGTSATFSVVASGNNLSYQWQRDAVNITGATARSYTLTAVTPADNGASFRCIVSNSGGSVQSNAALLTVLNNQPPLMQLISVGPAASSVVRSTNMKVECIQIGSSVSGNVQGNRFKLFLK